MNNYGLLQPQVFRDDRGSFREIFNMGDEPWRNLYFVQQNVSVSKKNVFRGMHYQYTYPQGKLITVLSGEVIDCIVDLRKWSTAFGGVQCFHLTGEGHETLWVPPCFAHGFLSLKDNTIFMYNVFEHPRVEGDEISITPYSFEQIKYKLDQIPDLVMSEKDRDGLLFDSAPYFGDAT